MSSERLSIPDAYALARALARLDHKEVECSAATRLLLDMFDLTQPDQYARLTTVLRDNEWMAQVMAVDPKAPLPSRKRAEIEAWVPPLPKEARLSDNALKAAEGTGAWLADFEQWAAANSPETPPIFLRAGGIWLIGLAIARRVYVHLHSKVRPHFYMLWIGESGVSKSTGLNQIVDIAYRVMPHMLLPEENSPEGLIANLAGEYPENMDKLPKHYQDRIHKGRRYAAQRGIILDEAQSLLGAGKRDYMQGLSEWLLKLYDGNEEYMRSTRSSGVMFVRHAGLSILGATTPAAMARAIYEDQWENGLLARYAIIYPDQKMAPNPRVTYQPPPKSLLTPLDDLHKRLPDPPLPHDDLFKVNYWPENSATIDRDAYNAYEQYTLAVRYGMVESGDAETRLIANYRRLHIQAMKVALALATIDWQTINDEKLPRITLGHWAAAQQITEEWRASLHRLLPVIDTSQDVKNQNKIIHFIKNNPDGVTKREICRALNAKTKAIDESLKVLIESGDVQESDKPSTENGGRPTVLYTPAEVLS